MRRFWKNGRKNICLTAVAMLLVGSLTACGSTSDVDVEQGTKDTLESSVQEEQGGEQQTSEAIQNEKGYFGEITAIDGTTLTVSVMSGGRGAGMMQGGEKPSGEISEGMEPVEMPSGEIPEGMEPGEIPSGEMPEGMEPVEMPSGEMPEGMEPGEMPSGEISEGMEPVEMPSGEMPEGMEPGEMPVEDIPRETMTVEVTDSTTITIDGESAQISELQVGDSIHFTLDGDVAVTINAGMAGGMEGTQKGVKPTAANV